MDVLDYEVLHRDCIELLRLKADPVGFKLFKEAREDALYIDKNLALCQVIKLAAIYSNVVWVRAENIDGCVIGSYVLGFRELPQNFYRKFIELRKISEDIAKKLVESIYRIQPNRYRSAVIAPLAKFKELNLDPDGALLFCNSTQAYLILVSYFDATGDKPYSSFNGHAACEFIAAIADGKSPWLTIPCGGARGLAEAQDDEIWIGMKINHLDVAIKRMKSIGLRYPPKVYEMLITPPNPEHPTTYLISRVYRADK